MTSTAAASPPVDGLAGRTAVVTGASSGIGAAIAQGLVDSGATVVGIDRAPAIVDGIHPMAADLSRQDQVDGLIERVARTHDGIDFLVNNAGLARHAAVTDIDLTELELMWSVNVRALIQLTRDAMRAMARPAGSGGRIVNVVSTAGLAGQAGESAYCATKFAARGFTEAAGEEGRLTGVRVTGIYPAGVHTAFWEGAVGDHADYVRSMHWLSPGVVAGQVLALIRMPLDVDVPTLVVRHPGDADVAGIAAKLDRIRRR